MHGIKPNDGFWPSMNQGLNPEACPYPKVDWQAMTQRPSSSEGRFMQEAIYPKNSILGPYMAAGRDCCESADTYLLSSILPVVGSMLARRVYIDWGFANIYPNLFMLLVGSPGMRKTVAVRQATKVAVTCLPSEAFLPAMLSAESLFDQYCIDEGGCPDKFLSVEEANTLMSTWTKSDYGARVAAEFLKLYDCGRLDEAFRQNKKEYSGGKRTVPETSTNAILAGTFNVAILPLEQIKQGIHRRFLFSVSELLGRTIIWPTLPHLAEIIDSFKPLLALSGEIRLPPKSPQWKFWENYQLTNRELINEARLQDEALSGRLTSAPTSVLKATMIFDACKAVYQGRKTLDTLSLDSLQEAELFVEAHMEAALFLDKHGERKASQEQAEVILATVRKDFSAQRPDTIYVTRTDLTRKFCMHTGRQGALTPDDLYFKIIPELERQGDAVRAVKRGKFEVFAFRTEFENTDPLKGQ